MSDLKNTFNPKEYKYILIVILLFVGVVIITRLSIFSGGFMGATTLYVLLRNQNKALVEKYGWKKSISALVILLEAIFIFLVPLSLVFFLVTNTILSADISIDIDLIQSKVFEFIHSLESRFNIEILTGDNFERIFSMETLSQIPKLSGDVIQFITSNGYSLVMNFLVILFVLYFMLYSYKEFETLIYDLLPFRKENKTIFTKETKLIIQANAIGIPLIAIIQGGLSYIGYLIFGVNTPLLFALLTAFATIIPVIGTSIIYIPLTIVLVLQGSYSSAIGLLTYSVFVVSNSDNIIRLLLQKRMADIHPLITLFGVLMGLSLFGFWGIIYGPLLLSLFMLMINMYRQDYVEGSNVDLAMAHNNNKTKKSKRIGLVQKMIQKVKAEVNNKNTD